MRKRRPSREPKEQARIREEIVRIATERRLSELCSGNYNVVSCINLAFIYVVRDVFCQDIDFSIPSFSREAVLHLSRSPPQGLNVKSYVDRLIEAVKSASRATFVFNFSLDTPLTIHTRWPYLPLEIGIAWHPILNVPYIPASSIKGALSAVAPAEVCGFKKTELFGTVESEGVLLVLDAYPIGWEKIVEPDVLTPHYREVAGDISEMQAQPTPLVFPVVPPGVTFTFIVALREQVPGNCALEIQNMLRDALANGLGAKTSVGYGLFKIR